MLAPTTRVMVAHTYGDSQLQRGSSKELVWEVPGPSASLQGQLIPEQMKGPLVSVAVLKEHTTVWQGLGTAGPLS